VQQRKFNSESGTQSNINTNPISTINKIDVQSRDAAVNGNNSNKDRESSAVKDDPITRYTFWLMIFTALLVVCNILLWVYTKKAADAAKKSANALPAIERAYVYVFISADMKNWREAKEKELAPLKIEVRNYGKTPARLTRIFIKKQIYEIKGTKYVPSDDDIDIIVDAPNRFVASGAPEEFSQDVRLHALVYGWYNLGEGDYYIEYSGDVWYTDIFNDSHVARFSWILHSRDYTRGFYISEADKNYTT
jgi:hypothetical protein